MKNNIFIIFLKYFYNIFQIIDSYLLLLMGEKVIDIRFEDLIYCIKMYSTSLNFFIPSVRLCGPIFPAKQQLNVHKGFTGGASHGLETSSLSLSLSLSIIVFVLCCVVYQVYV